jgi:hypothetical protein
LWHLKSWDDKDVSVVKLHCGECKKDFCGDFGDHSKCAIHNLFNNFKKSHTLSTLHIRAWCRPKTISFNDHPQTNFDKAVVASSFSLNLNFLLPSSIYVHYCFLVVVIAICFL